MLDFGRTTCRRIHPEPQPERNGSLVGTWYSLTLHPSGVLVSEAVNDVSDQQEEGTIPRPRNTMTGLVNGPDDRPDTAKHLSPNERAGFFAADAL